MRLGGTASVLTGCVFVCGMGNDVRHSRLCPVFAIITVSHSRRAPTQICLQRHKWESSLIRASTTTFDVKHAVTEEFGMRSFQSGAARRRAGAVVRGGTETLSFRGSFGIQQLTFSLLAATGRSN
jgi:hypothetical protein